MRRPPALPSAPPPGAPTPGAPARRGLLLAAGVVALLAAAAFVGVLDNGFLNFDDDRYITANPRVQNLDGEAVRWMLTDTSLFYWHPLTLLVHSLEVWAFGLRPGWHHATSVVLHAANAVLLLLLYLEVRRAAGLPAEGAAALAAGAAAAVLFAVHPLRVESVAWASEKKDLLCAFFMFLALLAWLRRGREAPGRRGRYTAAALAALVLALASKPMVVMLPALLLLSDGWPLRRFGREPVRRILLEKIPFVLLAAAALLPSVLDPRQADLLPTGASVDLGARATSALFGTASGIVRTAWPADLVPFYPVAMEGDATLGTWKYGGSLLLLLGGAGLSLALLRRRRFAFPAAFAFFLLAVLPVCGLRQAGSIETADRFTYVPTAPFFLLAGAGLHRLLLAGGRTAAAALAAAAAAALLLGALTVRQVEVWRDSESLWTRVVEAFPGRVNMAHNNLGAEFHRRGLAAGDAALLDRAEGEYRSALAIREDHAGAHANLGLLLLGRGDRDGAKEELLRAVALDPGLVLAHANLALLHLEAGEIEEARARYRTARERAGALPPRILDALAERLGEEVR